MGYFDKNILEGEIKKQIYVYICIYNQKKIMRKRYFFYYKYFQ